MSSQDASFLYVEDERNHMHIAVLAMFEGPAPKADEIERMIESKLDRIPRYRQCVRTVPLDLGQPVWVDDPHFDLAYHVRHTALPQPGTDDQLHTLVGRVMSQKLDRGRPLWELWVIEGLPDGEWALLSKTHHCVVDGVSGSELMTVILDPSPSEEYPAPRPWEPERGPGRLSLTAGAFAQGLQAPREGLRALGRAVSAPRRALRELASFADGLSTFRAFSGSALETSLNGPIGPHRRWRRAESSLLALKKIRSAHGGTLNDIILAAVTRGFRSLLIARGEPTEGLCVRSMVPASIRREEERGTFNNRVAAVFIDLPVGLADPLERLASVRASMDELKEHHQVSASESLLALTGFSPPALLALGARLFANADQQLVQTITTNVPGPRQPLFAVGRRMLSAYPYVPLTGTVRIAVAAFSYAGHLYFGITGDYETAADLDFLAAGIESGIEELTAIS